MNILAIGAHPDDIEFGCGGMLKKMSNAGHDIYMLVMTRGEMGGVASVRKKEQEKAARFLCAKKIIWGDLKDTHITTDRDVITLIEDVISDTKAEIVLITYYEDTHQDHRSLSNNAIASSRYIKNVLFYEVPTSQRFEPNVFVDISDVLEDKLKLLSIHASQVAKTGVDKLSILESAKSCANFRGFQARVKYAEGFKSLRLLLNP